MERNFSIADSLKVGWKKVRAHSALVFQVVLTFFAFMVLQEIVDRVLINTGIGALTTMALAVAGVFIGTGAMLIALKLARGEHALYQQIIPPWRLVWKYFVASLASGFLIALPGMIAAAIVLYNLAMSLGFDALRTIFMNLEYAVTPEEVRILLSPVFMNVGLTGYVAIVLAAVASVYLALRYSMVRFAILDGSEILESLSKSTKLTKGNMWHLAAFGLVLIVINLIGAIPFGLGLLITAPVSAIAYAHIYDRLKG